MSADLWQSLALFLAGVVASGVVMIIRGDFLGRKAAMETEGRLSQDIDQVAESLDQTEERLNSRMDREIGSVGRELREIKEALVRVEERLLQ